MAVDEVDCLHCDSLLVRKNGCRIEVGFVKVFGESLGLGYLSLLYAFDMANHWARRSCRWRGVCGFELSSSMS